MSTFVTWAMVGGDEPDSLNDFWELLMVCCPSAGCPAVEPSMARIVVLWGCYGVLAGTHEARRVPCAGLVRMSSRARRTVMMMWAYAVTDDARLVLSQPTPLPPVGR